MPPQTDCIQPVKGSSPSPSIGFKVFLHNRSMPASSCSRLDHSRVSLIRSLPLLVDVSLCPLSPDITSTSPVSHNPRLLAVEPFRSVTHPASPSTVYLPFPAFHLSLDLTLSPSSRSTKGDCLQSISRNREISISSYATEPPFSYLWLTTTTSPHFPCADVYAVYLPSTVLRISS